MSNSSRLLALIQVLLFLLCTASVANAAYDDPPGRVARLSHTQGEVSYSPAGENDWLSVMRNRPLIRGDRLWTDQDSRAEFQVSSAAIRLGSNTSVEILDLSDDVTQVQMTQGTLNLRVRRMYSGQVFEVDTPTLAFSISRAGRYRIDVDPRGDITTVVVWEGAGEAYGDNANFSMREGDKVRFYTSDLREYDMYNMPRHDDFDRYSLDRDERLERSASLRYMDDDVVGYADLDEYGDWRPVRSYGSVWFPSRVEADWAPYRDGHWVWQEPWGWTWVDDAPWGFAPSHYGRWVHVSNRWGWVPGPRNVRPIYSPALVAFISGSSWSVSLSLGGGAPIGWFPLGPREVYVPSYRASREYFTRVNVNNTVVNNTTITNVYNNYSTGTINVKQANYANRRVAGAVTAVPRNVFVNAQPVRKSALRLDRNAANSGEITRIAPIAPSVRSVIGAGTAARARPSREASERRVVARKAPPASERSFAAREQQLQKNPGRALESGAANTAQNRDASPPLKVRVIGEQRGAVDARAAGSRRSGDSSGTRTDTQTGQQDQDRARKAQTQQQEQSKRKADSERQAAEQQRAERLRQTEVQQQEQSKRKAESERQAAAQQRAERQRQTEIQQQEQSKRKAESGRQAAEQQRADRQRQTEVQQQEQSKRNAESERQAAEQQRAERQRRAEPRQQEQSKRTVDGGGQPVEPQQVERQRQVVTPPQEKAAKTKTPEQKRQAECEAQAILLHRDPRACRVKTKPKGSQDNSKESQDNPRGDRNSR